MESIKKSLSLDAIRSLSEIKNFVRENEKFEYLDPIETAVLGLFYVSNLIYEEYGRSGTMTMLQKKITREEILNYKFDKVNTGTEIAITISGTNSVQTINDSCLRYIERHKDIFNVFNVCKDTDEKNLFNFCLVGLSFKTIKNTSYYFPQPIATAEYLYRSGSKLIMTYGLRMMFCEITP